MYCRKCGKKLPKNAARCPYCQTDVIEVRQVPYAERYAENKKQQEEKRAELKREGYPSEVGYVQNNYVSYAILTSMVALILSVFPWPASWEVGTSLWMRLIILFFALAAMYNCIKGNQIHNHNDTNIKKYNKTHGNHTVYYEKPKALSLANMLTILVLLMATFSIFMG